jgi:hypothetical protein
VVIRVTEEITTRHRITITDEEVQDKVPVLVLVTLQIEVTIFEVVRIEMDLMLKEAPIIGREVRAVVITVLVLV